MVLAGFYALSGVSISGDSNGDLRVDGIFLFSLNVSTWSCKSLLLIIQKQCNCETKLFDGIIRRAGTILGRRNCPVVLTCGDVRC